MNNIRTNMRIGSFMYFGQAHYGVLVEGGVVPMTSPIRPTLRHWINAGLPGVVGLSGAGPLWPDKDVSYLPPVPDARHIVGVGLNTRSHFEETATLKNRKAGDYPKFPRLFLRGNASLVGHGSPLLVPHLSPTLDYEGEIGLVIGRPARNVPAADWEDYVVGITCVNDGSVRGYQRHADQVTAGKNFDRSGAWGPAIVTLDEIGEWRDLELVVDVNGERRQQLRMDDLIFSFGQLVEYVSQPIELQAGDVILTGSPAGIGALTGRYLQPGDDVAVSLVDGASGRRLLQLSNPVLED